MNSDRSEGVGGAGAQKWTFLTSHARVLILIARDPGIRMRDVAAAAGITERTTQAIVADLESAGYLTRTREGRRNLYTITAGTRFRHAAEAGHAVAGLLALFNAVGASEAPPPHWGTASGPN